MPRNKDEMPEMTPEEMAMQKAVFENVLRTGERYLFTVVRTAFQCAANDRAPTQDELTLLDKDRAGLANMLQMTLVNR